MHLRVLAIAASLATAVLPSVAPAQPRQVGEGTQPRLATGAAGEVFVTFAKRETVMVAASIDDGQTFATPTVVATITGLPLGMRRGPRIAACSGTVVISAIESARGGGKDGDLFAWVSADAGKAWTKSAKPLNSVAAAAREGLHDMGSDGKGLVAVVWLDMRKVNKEGGGTEVWVATSADGGKTWGEDRLAYVNSGGTVCECCNPSITFGPKGEMFVMFRNALNGSRNMYLTASSDGGKTWSPATKLGEGTWMLNACPMDGGTVTASAGKPVTVWRRAGSIYLSEPSKDERLIGEGIQPVVEFAKSGPVVVWQEGSTLVHWRPDTGPAKTLAEKGQYPVLTPTKRGQVLAAWEASGTIMTQLIGD